MHRFPACRSVIGRRLARRQLGVSLVAVLMILAVVSLLGLGAAQLSVMGEHGARNERDAQIAQQSAEAALMDAEYDMRGPGVSRRAGSFARGQMMEFDAGCGTHADGNRKGLCLPAATGKPVWLTVSFTQTGSNARTAEFGDFTDRAFAADPAGVALGVMPARKPRYLIEVLPDGGAGHFLDAQSGAERYVYRVTAMGFGPRVDVQTILQMLYRKD